MSHTPPNAFRPARTALPPAFPSSVALLTLLLSGCAVASVPVRTPLPELTAEISPAFTTELPAVPEVRGPINIRVQHPADGTLLAVDSTFVFGTVGTGDARLRINGTSVPVASNGAFLAYLAVPSGQAPVFALEVARDVPAPTAADSSRGTVRIRRPTRTALPRGRCASCGQRFCISTRCDAMARR